MKNVHILWPSSPPPRISLYEYTHRMFVRTCARVLLTVQLMLPSAWRQPVGSHKRTSAPSECTSKLGFYGEQNAQELISSM